MQLGKQQQQRKQQQKQQKQQEQQEQQEQRKQQKKQQKQQEQRKQQKKQKKQRKQQLWMPPPGRASRVRPLQVSSLRDAPEGERRLELTSRCFVLTRASQTEK